MSENKNQIIRLEGIEGDVIELNVLEQTVLQGVTYLLAFDESQGEDAECFILRKDTEDEDNMTYEFVEDETLLENLMKIFEELLEDVDLEVLF